MKNFVTHRKQKELQRKTQWRSRTKKKIEEQRVRMRLRENIFLIEMKSIFTKLNTLSYIYSYNHGYNRIDTIQLMRLNSRKLQLIHNCSSLHSNCHLSSFRRHRLIRWWEAPITQSKRCVLLMPLMKRCASALIKRCALNNRYNFKQGACYWTWVEPEPPFFYSWASSSTGFTLKVCLLGGGIRTIKNKREKIGMSFVW